MYESVILRDNYILYFIIFKQAHFLFVLINRIGIVIVKNHKLLSY